MTRAVDERPPVDGQAEPLLQAVSERRYGRSWLAMPAFVLLTAVALWAYVGRQELDSIERRSIDRQVILTRLLEHLELALVATAIVVAIGVPVGVLLTRGRGRRLVPLVVGAANVGQAVPSIGLIVLLAIFWGIGWRTAVVALIAASVLPVLRNTLVGIRGVDPRAVKAAAGLGMSPWAVLCRIELPLAVPVLLAGIRVALIYNVGTATLATLIGAGGLGDLINAGIVLDRPVVLLVGSVSTALLALTVDWLAGLLETALRPRGLS